MFAIERCERFLVSLNEPYAPVPLACTTRSGILSRLNCASFSKRLKFSAASGTLGAEGIGGVVLCDG